MIQIEIQLTYICRQTVGHVDLDRRISREPLRFVCLDQFHIVENQISILGNSEMHKN